MWRQSRRYRLVLKLSTPHNQSHSVALYHGEHLTSRSSQQSGVLNLSIPRYTTLKIEGNQPVIFYRMDKFYNSETFDALNRVNSYYAARCQKLEEELRNAYIQMQTDATPRKKPVPVRTIVRWEPGWTISRGGSSYNNRNRASGVVTKNGFFEFIRHIDGTTNHRTYFNSVEDWMASIPSQANEEFSCEKA